MSGRGDKPAGPALTWPYSQQKPAEAPVAAGSGVWTRSDGTKVQMADMNPYHRAAAIKKAERDGDRALADQLRASGALPE
ncbi:hypothetical protein LOS78_01665 [Paracoccus sp. MA]|uniref:hypothetical protein n=1 Tax=Paracoccus sp. MA TaxID=2895796 RepID=UPI001E51024D|nr:hypothetical protein [Paracoccus sp. MA]UFM64206.1 hypothetical protein LOS78_01665 [Paracoccus sp. MA]